jgi:hypothetical protein
MQCRLQYPFGVQSFKYPTFSSARLVGAIFTWRQGGVPEGAICLEFAAISV